MPRALLVFVPAPTAPRTSFFRSPSAYAGTSNKVGRAHGTLGAGSGNGNLRCIPRDRGVPLDGVPPLAGCNVSSVTRPGPRLCAPRGAVSASGGIAAGQVHVSRRAYPARHVQSCPYAHTRLTHLSGPKMALAPQSPHAVHSNQARVGRNGPRADLCDTGRNASIMTGAGRRRKTG